MNAYSIADKYKMLSRDEVDLIKRCVLMLPDNPAIVNIGANVGTSTCAMLEANHNAFIYSIDKKHCPEERENIIACGFNPYNVFRIRGDSKRVNITDIVRQVDMTFIDGGHDDETLKSDIAKFVPTTKQIVLFHDYHHPNYRDKPEVHLDEIVDEAMKDWDKVGEARYLVAFERRSNIK